MGPDPFRFLDDEQFQKLDRRARVAYLVRAQQELLARQEVLREQRRRVIGDPEATVPVPPLSAGDEQTGSGQKQRE